jgi:hypothetical protein
MSDDAPKPVYSPEWQTRLPGFAKEVPRAQKDWRPWRNEKGEQIDSPPHRGPQFTGKIIPPLVGKDGKPITNGPLHIVRDARGNFNIIDWSLPITASASSEAAESEGTAPIMGRIIYQTQHSLERACAALGILAEQQRDRAKGLPKDPALCHDLKGAPIVLHGKLWLGRFARGRFKDHYVLVDDRIDLAMPRHWLIFNKQTKTLKEAVPKFVAEVARRKVAPRKKKYVWPEMQFSPPEGFGGSGGFAGDRECPTPDSKSWDVVVDLYARTGKWCQTARLIWAGNYPQELVEQCENYRAEFLENPAAFFDDIGLDLPLNDDEREAAESHAAVRGMLEAFPDSTLLSFKERTQT